MSSQVTPGILPSGPCWISSLVTGLEARAVIGLEARAVVGAGPGQHQ